MDVPTPSHGWDYPWPNVFEVAKAFPAENWTLVGGLMVQVQALAHGVPVSRPTADVDMLLHIQLVTSVSSLARRQLERLGYDLLPPTNLRGPAYRFKRGDDVIDVLSPDHTGKLRPHFGRDPMFPADGGRQALERRMVLALLTEDGTVEVSVPDELGALVLKGAAYLADSRDRGRHLADAATLAACVTDHATDRARLKGSDGTRLRRLAEALADPRHPAWLLLPEPHRTAGRDTLRILARSRGAAPSR